MNHKKSSLGKSRDFGISGANGKGSKSRVTSHSAYAEGYDGIDWGRSKINPAWVNAPCVGLDTGPASEHEDFEIWVRR